MQRHVRASRREVGDAVRGNVRRPSKGPQDQLLDLQRQAGNAAVTGLLQRAPSEGPASTDIADVADGAAAKGATADIHARVLKYDVVHGQVRITIGSGPDQGVEVGMAGSLLVPTGDVDFVVETASGRISTAYVHATPDDVNASTGVIMNPSGVHAPPKPKGDIHARVIKFDIDKGQGKITIASGSKQGIQVGMLGTLLSDGREIADFTVETAEGRWSTAHVSVTLDQLGGESEVVIKASSAPESQDGKQF